MIRLGTRLLLCLAALAAGPMHPPAASARPWVCLPPAFDRGLRLHPLPNPDVYWFELMLRQHELCWRPAKEPDELRVLLFGNSAVYGYPLPAEQSVAGLLNAHFDESGVPAHIFNLAMVTPYQVRDAIMMREALPFAPDVIVYPVTLAEFRHLAPMPDPVAARFFSMNAAALQRAVDDPPAGLEEPLGIYRTWLTKWRNQRHWNDQLRDLGLYARRAARAWAEAVSATFNSPTPAFQPPPNARRTAYDCATAEKGYQADRDWKKWNILAYLEDLQRTHGIRILVVHWPIAHEPVGKCYSFRFTDAAVHDFSDWLRAETAQRGLAYLDLRDLLPPDLFVDSLHVTAAGHVRIADALARVLDPMLREEVTARRALAR